ncbi:Chorion transcription factor Cf2 [Orchesella cincta]|uniref:Chorion transcription factor Cf2 n=1 Tax=Orchesella cincta TaxID=48709 RepID=A0A1D2MZN1_ORCCI|nr:Chorion transcription factor Cf2 [Orchesella cincta]
MPWLVFCNNSSVLQIFDGSFVFISHPEKRRVLTRFLGFDSVELRSELNLKSRQQRTEKICLVCGINMNKRPRHDKYNYVHPSQRARGKVPVSQESESDSDLGSDSDSSSGKSKRKTPKRRTPVAASSGRQTRNQNPKAFASSLCKALKLPATPDEPFLRIFSAADYCPDCMTKVKDIHDSQKELEKIQSRLDEYKVDIELDLSKHLQKIPFCSNVLKNDAFSRYKEDINLILDYNDGNKEGSDEDGESKKQASRLKRKSENGPRSREAKKQKVVYKEDSEEEDFSETSKSKSAARRGNSSIKKEEVEEEAVEDESPEEPQPAKKESSEVTQISSDSEVGEKLVELKSGGSSPEIVEVEPSKPAEFSIAKKVRDPSLKCPICVVPRYFEYRENLEAHITTHKSRKDRRSYNCEFCGKEFDRPNRLQLHLSKAHPNGEKDGGESDGSSALSGWLCGFCGEEFQRKKLMEEHLDAHPEAKPLNCHACGRTFKRLESLQKGFQIYKGQPVDPCKYCNRSIPLKDYLAHNQQLLTENNGKGKISWQISAEYLLVVPIQVSPVNPKHEEYNKTLKTNDELC